jgi:hypothetical protein
MKRNDIDSIISSVLNEEFNKRSNLLFEKKVKKSVDEKLVGKQSKIDKNKNGKIDSEDFKLLKKGKNKVKMTEEGLISFIEDIINEAETDFSYKKPKSLNDVETLLKKSKKENESNLANVGKKMKEYLKYGSNGKYVENPDSFPKTNGQLKKGDIMAYRMDDSEEEYLEELGRGPGMENLVYDEMDPDEDKLKDYIEGSSRTGNNPKWANSVETDVNDRVNKRRKNNYYGSEKKRAYEKSQDVHIVQNDKGRPDFIKKMQGESVQNNEVLSEEFIKMKKLINYNKITQ